MAKGLSQDICYEDEGTTQLVAKVPLFALGVYRRAPCDLCTVAGQVTGCGFQTSCSPSKNVGLVGPFTQPQCPTPLHHNDFLLPGDLKGSWDIWEMRKEKTLALAKALQSYSEWSGGPYSMMCGAARDLQGCMANLMWFEEGDILEIPLLEPTDDLPIASPTPEEEASLLGEPQEAQATATCPSRHKEWAPKPKDAAKLMETATESQGM